MWVNATCHVGAATGQGRQDMHCVIPGPSPNRRHRQNPSGSSPLTTPRPRPSGSRRSACCKIQVRGICAPARQGQPVQSRHAGIDLRAELTDWPPGTEEGSDNVTECHISGDDFGGRVPPGRGPRAALPEAVYMSVQMLEIDLKNCHFRHFPGPSARLPGGTAWSARCCSMTRSDIICAGPGVPRTEWV